MNEGTGVTPVHASTARGALGWPPGTVRAVLAMGIVVAFVLGHLGGAWLLLGATDHRAFDLVLVWLAWMNGVLAVATDEETAKKLIAANKPAAEISSAPPGGIDGLGRIDI